MHILIFAKLITLLHTTVYLQLTLCKCNRLRSTSKKAGPSYLNSVPLCFFFAWAVGTSTSPRFFITRTALHSYRLVAGVYRA